MRTVTIVMVLTTMLVSPATLAEDWPQFRGPRGGGCCQAQNLPTTWGGFLEPPAWTARLPGTGWSSPIVVAGRVWVTAAEQTALNDEALTAKLADHPYGEVFQAHAAIKLLAVELDAKSGKMLRRIDLLEVKDPAPIHASNSYATPTPVTDGQRVYCHFGSLGTFCISIDSGEITWRQRFVVDDITGPAASPVLWNNSLFLVRDGCDQQYVVALDKFSGHILWQQSRPPIKVAADKQRRSFSTPLVIEHEGQSQLIAPAAQWAVSLDPKSGQELWRVRLAEDGYAVIPRPVYSEGLVYLCSGYQRPKLLAVSVDGSGDVTETHIRWTYDRQVPLIASPLVSDRELYIVSNIGIATCLDNQTGNRLWQQRLPGNFAASPTLADNKLYFTSEEGVTTVARPGREFHEIARNRLFGQTMSCLAVTGDSILIRTASALYCLRKTRYDGLSTD